MVAHRARRDEALKPRDVGREAADVLRHQPAVRRVARGLGPREQRREAGHLWGRGRCGASKRAKGKAVSAKMTRMQM